MKCSAILITKNEEAKIKACLESIAFCNEIIVIDSGSTDNTVEIARANGARVSVRTFDDYASQKNHALDQTKHEWVLSIDADEQVDQKLAQAILAESKENTSFSAFRVKRTNIIFHQKHRFGGHQDDRPLRLFRKNQGRFMGMIHEEWKHEGSVGELGGELLHYSTENLKEYMHKLNHYTDLEVLQSEVTVVKGRDLWVRPFARFMQRYFLKLGVLDGGGGFVFAFLSAYYEFIRYVKLWNRYSGFSDKI